MEENAKKLEAKEEKKKKLSQRIIEIDILRGVAVLFMIFDHFFYDVAGLLPNFFKTYPWELWDFAYKYWNWDFRWQFRYVIVFIFLSLTGICCSFSKSNLNRGLKLMGIAFALSIGTYLVGKYYIEDLDSVFITFGVLHCIALSLIIIGLLEKAMAKLNWNTQKWVYLVISLIMFSIGVYTEYYRNANFGNTMVSYYDNDLGTVIFYQMIGLVKAGGDNFQIFLNGGQIFFGVFLGKALYKEKKSLFKNAKYSNNPVTFLGRYSLWVYFIHQVAMPLIIGLVLLILGYQLY